MSKPVSSALTAVSLIAATSLARMFAQVSPSTESTNLRISIERELLRDVDAGALSEPVSHSISASRRWVRKLWPELAEALHAGAHQVADEADRVP